MNDVGPGRCGPWPFCSASLPDPVAAPAYLGPALHGSLSAGMGAMCDSSARVAAALHEVATPDKLHNTWCPCWQLQDSCCTQCWLHTVWDLHSTAKNYMEHGSQTGWSNGHVQHASQISAIQPGLSPWLLHWPVMLVTRVLVIRALCHMRHESQTSWNSCWIRYAGGRERGFHGPELTCGPALHHRCAHVGLTTES